MGQHWNRVAGDTGKGKNNSKEQKQIPPLRCGTGKRKNRDN